MTLAEAIEIVKDYNSSTFETSYVPFSKALQLVIEAGKLVEVLRAGLPRNVVKLLPGETRE